MVRCDIEFSDLRGPTPPSIQIIAIDNNGNIIASSAKGQSFGSVLNGAVTWRNNSFEFIPRLLVNEEMFFVVILHRPDSAGLVEFSLHNGNRIYASDPVDLSSGKDVDWFVLCVARWQQGNLMFKNISSFPNARGDVAPQLKDLISWLSEGEEAQTAWIPTSATAMSYNLCVNCDKCKAKDEEIRLLKVEVEKQAILIRKLREERKHGLVSELLGPETLLSVTDEDLTNDEGIQVDKLLQTQEELIGSIKQHLVKLANQISTGQRMRAISG